MGKFRSIQILRGWSALLVLWHHCGLGLVGRLDPGALFPVGFRLAGMFGVDVFFVISGFIITTTAFGSRQITAMDFMLRRIGRIVPLYWLMTLPWIPIVMAWGPFDWRQASASLTFWPAYGRMVLPVLGVGWSLCFEMLFYVAVGVVLWGRRSAALAVAIGTLYLAIAASRLIHDSPVSGFLGNGMVLEFVAGVALAVIHRRTSLRPWIGAGALILGVSLWLCVSPTFDLLGFAGLVDGPSGHLDWARAGMCGPSAVLIVWGALQVELMVAGRGWDWAVYLGTASFSVYLVHTLPLYGGFLLAGGVRRAFAIPYVLGDMAVAIGCSLLVYEMVERPLMRLAKYRPPGLPTLALTPAHLAEQPE